MRLPDSGPRGPANESGKDLVKPCRCGRYWTCVCQVPRPTRKKKVTRLRFVAIPLIILGAGVSTAVGAGASSSQGTTVAERPDWCKPHWECVTTTELAEETIEKIKLEQIVLELRGKQRRFGCVVGGGVGISAVVDIDYNVHYPIAPNLGVSCGLRF